jgi:hypothetical protein
MAKHKKDKPDDDGAFAPVEGFGDEYPKKDEPLERGSLDEDSLPSKPSKPEEAALAKAGGPVVPPPDDKPPPKYGTQRKAGPGELPRICHPLERAGKGQRRFKISCRNYGPQPTRYILADEDATEDDAKHCYLESTSLGAELARLKENAGPDVKIEPPAWVVTELAD